MSNIKKHFLTVFATLLMGFFSLAAIDYQMHTVRKGDNLYNISKQYNVTVDEIKTLNNLNNINLDIGQKLKIKPIKGTPKSSTESSSTQQIYTVKKGDNLYKISKQYGIKVDDLKQWNNLSSNSLVVGQKLTLKPPVELSQPKPKILAEEAQTTPEITYTERIHKVKKGDNLLKISKKYDISVPELKKLNNLSSNKLHIGQKLKVKVIKEIPKPEIKKVPAERDTVKTLSAADKGSIVKPSDLPETYFYIVQPKDNLFRIAVNHNITFAEILRFNGLKEDNIKIHPGQKIIIKDPAAYKPEIDASSQTADNEDIDKTEGVQPAVTDSVLMEKVYIVQRKDTLFRIAKDNNMTVEELKRLNKLTSNALKVGQKLYIVAPSGIKKPEVSAPIVTEEDLKAKVKLRSDLIMPVDGKVISEFGIRNGRPHKGIDLGAPTGYPVFAVLDGTVVYSGLQGNYGNVVVLEHPDYIMTVYAHNEKNLVSVGETVKQGQVIATTGSTGNAVGSHVHFEYRIKGKAINPRKVLPLGK